MFSFIVQNIATIIVLAILVAAVTIVMVVIVNNRKKGKSPCGGECAGCPISASCNKEKKDNR